jgi:phage gpG-like protein
MAFRFDQKIKEIQKLKRTLPAQVGNIAKNHFLKSFRDEGFTDVGLDPWKARKTRDKSDRRNPNKKRALLVKTGQLKRSIRVGRATWNRIEVGSYGTAYASRHNKGLAGMPKRQFIGESAQMNRKIRNKIRTSIKTALR